MIGDGRMTTRISLATLAMALSGPAWAQADAPADEIVVNAQRANRTEVTRGGQLGALGDKAAEDVPFSIKSYNAALILNQQPTTLGQVLENDPSIRTTYGFGNAAELFIIRGFELAADDIALDGMYGLTPRQLVAPELYESVQVLNGASAFLNGAAPGGTAIGGTVNLIPKRAGDRDVTRVTGSFIGDGHFGGSADVSRRFGGDGAFGVRINGAARRRGGGRRVPLHLRGGRRARLSRGGRATVARRGVPALQGVAPARQGAAGRGDGDPARAPRPRQL